MKYPKVSISYIYNIFFILMVMKKNILKQNVFMKYLKRVTHDKNLRSKNWFKYVTAFSQQSAIFVLIKSDVNQDDVSFPRDGPEIDDSEPICIYKALQKYAPTLPSSHSFAMILMFELNSCFNIYHSLDFINFCRNVKKNCLE